MYIPSYDMSVLELPQFSPLQLGSTFGITGMFNSNTPTAFVDHSLNSIRDIIDPYQDDFNYFAYPQSLNIPGFENYFQGQPKGYYDPTTGRMAGQTRAEVEAEVERRKKVFESARDVYDKTQAQIEQAKQQAQGTGEIPLKCPPGQKEYRYFFGLFRTCGTPMQSDEKGVIGDDPAHSAKQVEPFMKRFETFINTAPAGTGIFLLAIVAIIFLLLFVRK